jgi:hypothetical protein
MDQGSMYHLRYSLSVELQVAALALISSFFRFVFLLLGILCHGDRMQVELFGASFHVRPLTWVRSDGRDRSICGSIVGNFKLRCWCRISRKLSFLLSLCSFGYVI